VDTILQVFVIFVAAKAAAEIFVRLRLPAIAGELLVGILLGPHVAAVIKVNQASSALSELGVVILLFTVGLETSLPDLIRVGRAALVTSMSGIVAAGATGTLVVWAFGYPVRTALLAGTALAASSVGVAARVFQDLGVASSRPARVVLGASVVDDVVVLALFPLVQGFGTHGSSVGGALVGVAGAVVFIVLTATLGSRLAGRHAGLLDRPRVRRAPFVLALGLCLGLAALAEQVGLAALVGAFLAGIVLAGTRDRYELDRRMLPLFDFLVPFFFVITAARMDPRVVLSGGLLFGGVLTAVTVLAKMGAGAGAAIGLPARERLQVGCGMIPRNEVTLVVASAGAASGSFGPKVFSILVAAALVSTLVAGPILRGIIPQGREPGRERHEGPPEAPGGESEERRGFEDGG
jgi:Kef-type K+ transport system membrane component KefB